MTNNDVPAVWVGCLACYNNGILVGDWFDADEIPVSEEAWREALLMELPAGHAEGHEEVWVFDHQGWGGLISGEVSPAEAARVWGVVSDLAKHEREGLALYAANMGDEIDAELIKKFREAYCGRWDSMEEYAEDYAESVGAINSEDWLHRYVDWGRVASDLLADGYFTEASLEAWGVHVYRIM